MGGTRVSHARVMGAHLDPLGQRHQRGRLVSSNADEAVRVREAIEARVPEEDGVWGVRSGEHHRVLRPGTKPEPDDLETTPDRPPNPKNPKAKLN